jgi:hypothetical protein
MVFIVRAHLLTWKDDFAKAGKVYVFVNFEAQRSMPAFETFRTTQRSRGALITQRLFGSLCNLRQAHTHFCPTTIGTHQLDIAAMRSSQLSRDAQAEPMSWHTFAAAHPVKALE